MNTLASDFIFCMVSNPIKIRSGNDYKEEQKFHCLNDLLRNYTQKFERIFQMHPKFFEITPEDEQYAELRLR